MSGEMELCDGCELARPCPHPHCPVDPIFRSTRSLELVHADLAGPIKVQSWGGAEYMFVLVNDFSRKSWVIFLKTKDEAAERLKEWKAVVENKRGLKLVALRTDNGGEFTSVAPRTYLKEKGVSQHCPSHFSGKWGGRKDEPHTSGHSEVDDARHGAWWGKLGEGLPCSQLSSKPWAC